MMSTTDEILDQGDAMSEMTERLERMERKVRVLSRWVVGLRVILVGCVTLGAAGPQSLALRRLAIVDDSGAERIVVGTLDDGTAAIEHYDRDGKRRITTATFDDGEASIQHFDRDGKTRISTGTLNNGDAVIQHTDRDGKMRILTGG